MAPGRRSLVAALLLALASAAPAAAKSISISIAPRIELRDGGLVAQVRVSNSGDDIAQSVTPVLRFGDQQVRAEARPELGPNQSMEATLSLPVGALGPGRWAYQVAVDYTDANQYPFQALHAGLLTVGNPPPAKAAVSQVTADPVAKSGTVRVKVKNLADVTRAAILTVLAPEGVEVTTPVQQLTLGGWEEKSLSARLTNRTALAGSRYPIFVTLHYDDDGVRQTAVAQGLVEIRASQSFFQERQTALLVGAAVLVAGWLGVLAWWLFVGRPRRVERGS